jgi:hypothetical protein
MFTEATAKQAPTNHEKTRRCPDIQSNRRVEKCVHFGDIMPNVG